MRFTLLLKIDENQTKYVNQLFSRQWSGTNCDPWLVWKKWGVRLDCLSFTPLRGFSGPNPERIYAEPENSLRWWKQGVSSLKTRIQSRKKLQRENSRGQHKVLLTYSTQYWCYTSVWRSYLRLERETQKRIKLTPHDAFIVTGIVLILPGILESFIVQGKLNRVHRMEMSQ